MLRPGNVHSADRWKEVLEPVVQRYKHKEIRKYFRGDAAFAKPEGIVHFYNGRGTAKQWIKEGKYALNWTRLSCKRFVSNRVRLWLFVLAYNLGNFLRRLVLPKKIKHWSLRSLLVKLIKIGAKIVRHSRYITFQMAEVAIGKRLFAEILARIDRLRNYSV